MRASRCGMATLRNDAVAGAHAHGDRLQFVDQCLRKGRACRTGIAALRDDAVEAAHVLDHHLHVVDQYVRE